MPHNESRESCIATTERSLVNVWLAVQTVYLKVYFNKHAELSFDLKFLWDPTFL